MASLFEAAKVTGGTITEIHHNWCPSLNPEQPGRCTCAETAYRLVITPKRMRSHLTITSAAVRS